jgi:YD repeat-containing protein
MQRLGTYVEVGLLVPALALVATSAHTVRDADPPGPPLDVVVTVESVEVVEPAPLAKYPGACTEAYDFRFPTHIGADGTPDEIVTKTYDAHGRLATSLSQRADAPDRMWMYRYDQAGRLVEVVRRAYGRIVGITTHRYDRAGREVEIAIDEDVDGRADWLTIKTYDRAGRLATMRENVNAHRPRKGFGNWYFYDGDRLVRHEQDNDHDGVPNLEILHAYDEHGRLARKQTRWYDEAAIGDVFTYTYDEHGRLATETDRYGFAWTHRYDAAGNLIEKTRELPPQVLDRSFPAMRVTYDYSCWR